LNVCDEAARVNTGMKAGALHGVAQEFFVQSMIVSYWHESNLLFKATC
jgi:hypothetical protein